MSVCRLLARFSALRAVGIALSVSAGLLVLGSTARGAVSGQTAVRGEPREASSFGGSLGLSSLTYLATGASLQQTRFSLARIQFQARRTGNEIAYAVDGRLGVGLDCGTECSSIEFPELSIGSSSRLGPVSFHVGRMLLPWSALDDEWKLGVFQPRFVYDFLHPRPVGLAGAFLKFESPLVRTTVFATPGFIPDRGLPVNVDNGRIGSIDPFFHAPISEVLIEGRSTPIAYRLNRPALAELLMKPGFGVNSRIGGDSGWSLGASYAFKPVNQILLSYNSLYNLSFEVADADIFPRVVMHHLGSADLQYSGERLSAGLSVVREVPVLDSVPDEWTSQQIAPAWLLSPRLSWKSSRFFRVSGSYLHVVGGNAPDLNASSGPSVSGDSSVFNARYFFTRALRFQATDRLWSSATQSLDWRSQVIVDLANSAQVYMHSLAYQPAPTWQVRLATDILVGDEAGTDFISRNRANDRFFGAVSYVF